MNIQTKVLHLGTRALFLVVLALPMACAKDSYPSCFSGQAAVRTFQAKATYRPQVTITDSFRQVWIGVVEVEGSHSTAYVVRLDSQGEKDETFGVHGALRLGEGSFYHFSLRDRELVVSGNFDGKDETFIISQDGELLPYDSSLDFHEFNDALPPRCFAY